MEIGLLRPVTLSQVIMDVVGIDILIPANITQVTVEDMSVEVDLGHNIPANIHI